MKTLKAFANGCYSETLLLEAAEESKAGGSSAAAEGSTPSQEKKKEDLLELDTGEKEATLVDALPPAPPYHAGLGARYKFPGDPRKLREKSKMKLWKDYLRGELCMISF